MPMAHSFCLTRLRSEFGQSTLALEHLAERRLEMRQKGPDPIA